MKDLLAVITYAPTAGCNCEYVSCTIEIKEGLTLHRRVTDTVHISELRGYVLHQKDKARTWLKEVQDFFLNMPESTTMRYRDEFVECGPAHEDIK